MCRLTLLIPCLLLGMLPSVQGFIHNYVNYPPLSYTPPVSSSYGSGLGNLYSNGVTDLGYQTRNTYLPPKPVTSYTPPTSYQVKSYQPISYPLPSYTGQRQNYRQGPVNNGIHVYNRNYLSSYDNSIAGLKPSYNQLPYSVTTRRPPPLNNPPTYTPPSYKPPRKLDPCRGLSEGDYPLLGQFQAVFRGVDPRCNFVKCANGHAYVSPCSPGSKNDPAGRPHVRLGFCAYRDGSSYCGRHQPASLH